MKMKIIINIKIIMDIDLKLYIKIYNLILKLRKYKKNILKDIYKSINLNTFYILK